MEIPPAPTSCIKLIGFLAFLALNLSKTCCALLCISGLDLCTDAKSKSLLEDPPFTELAEPPPRPISMLGPPKTITKSFGSGCCFSTCISFIEPTPPANIIGL